MGDLKSDHLPTWKKFGFIYSSPFLCTSGAWDEGKGSNVVALPLFAFSIYCFAFSMNPSSNCFPPLSSSTVVMAQKETQASRKLLLSFISEAEEPGLGRWRTELQCTWNKGLSWALGEHWSGMALLSCPELRQRVRSFEFPPDPPPFSHWMQAVPREEA